MASKIEVVLNVVDQATKQLDRVEGRFQRFGTQVEKSFRSVGLGSLVGAAAVAAVGRAAILAAAEVDELKAKLLGVTGSTEEATKKYNALRDIFRGTAIDAEDAARSYISLRSLGIDPTAEQMKTLGGISLLFGRDIDDVAQSVNALTQRSLRSLGIEMERSGNKAIITSGNVRRVVHNDNASIRAAIFETWAERFPDAVEQGSRTFSGQIRVIKNAWEDILEDLGGAVLPDLTKGIGKVLENFQAIRGTVMAVVGAVRIAFNALQIAVDSIITYFLILGTTVRIVFTAIINGAKIAAEPMRFLVENIVTLASRAAQLFEGIATGDWKKIKAAGAGIMDDWKQNWSEMSARMGADWGAVVSEFRVGVASIVEYSKVWNQSTSKNMDDVADAMLNVAQAYQTAGAAAKNVKLGSGDMGAGASSDAQLIEGINKRIAATKAEIKVIQEKIRINDEAQKRQQEVVKANRYYSDLVVANVRDEGKRKKIEIDQEEARQLQQAEAWYKADIVSYQRYEELKNEIHKNASDQRAERTKQEISSTIDSTTSLVHTLIGLGQQMTASSKKEAQERKAILRSLAIADAAAAAVKGIYDVWMGEGDSIWYKIAMTAVVAAEIIASTASQINSINTSYARGTSFAQGGRSLVGEEGPEMVTMPRGSRVYTNYQTRNTNVAGDTINLSFGGAADRSTVDYAMSKLESWTRQRTYAARNGYLRFA